MGCKEETVGWDQSLRGLKLTVIGQAAMLSYFLDSPCTGPRISSSVRHPCGLETYQSFKACPLETTLLLPSITSFLSLTSLHTVRLPLFVILYKYSYLDKITSSTRKQILWRQWLLVSECPRAALTYMHTILRAQGCNHSMLIVLNDRIVKSTSIFFFFF